jgi:hypothetical protein
MTYYLKWERMQRKIAVKGKAADRVWQWVRRLSNISWSNSVNRLLRIEISKAQQGKFSANAGKPKAYTQGGRFAWKREAFEIPFRVNVQVAQLHKVGAM